MVIYLSISCGMVGDRSDCFILPNTKQKVVQCIIFFSTIKEPSQFVLT